jgi:hypothetical protein
MRLHACFFIDLYDPNINSQKKTYLSGLEASCILAFYQANIREEERISGVTAWK